jgi:serine/threonine protein kinase
MPEIFQHPGYTLEDDDRLARNAGLPPASMDETQQVLQEIGRYVQDKLVNDMGFESLTIPADDEEISTSVLASSDWQTSDKLLVIIQNAVGSLMGIFSRSLCLDEGLSKGTMLPYIKRAQEAGCAVMILRPNTNSVTVTNAETNVTTKSPILGSESPEAHALFVWENIITKADNIRRIVLLGYGNGASLCKDLFVRQMVKSKEDETDVNRIAAVVTIEASTLIETDDPDDVRRDFKSVSVNMQYDAAPRGYRLNYRLEKLGCVTFSLGLPPGKSDPLEVQNVASSVSLAIDPVFAYIALALAGEGTGGKDLTNTYASEFATAEGHSVEAAQVVINPNAAFDPPAPPAAEAAPEEEAVPQGFFSRLFGPKPSRADDKGKDSGKSYDDEKLAVTDFDLLKVVGKGAFGKVMLVRKKNGSGSGQIYAMKVLKKSVVAAKGQIEHTKSERSILCEIRHPYIVRLRFAFQSDDKLYLVTDYYNGGSLFYHLRKSRSFTEVRAKFYGAQLLSALHHLHSQHIIYRDLKLENVLMDSVGNIALTDFGLSKQNIDSNNGASTFCGTAEYIAPELLKGQTYGVAVDWWSFGILLFEMMHGRTPFYDKNRKLMFYRIINTAPGFPPHFSSEACDCIRGLLTVNEKERLGSKAATGNGAKDIMECPFFASIDFEALDRKEIPPPFRPEVVNELDTKYVPKTYLQAEARDSLVVNKKGDVNPNFEAFTFGGESAMTGGEEEDAP